jgi:hypothetical protein
MLSFATYPVSAFQDTYRAMLTHAAQVSTRLLVIRDSASEAAATGAGHALDPSCFRVPSDTLTACSGSRSWVSPDALYETAMGMTDSNVDTVDLNPYICRPTRCDAVVGGVVVRYDTSHLTATFVTTMAPYLLPYVTRAFQ